MVLIQFLEGRGTEHSPNPFPRLQIPPIPPGWSSNLGRNPDQKPEHSENGPAPFWYKNDVIANQIDT